MNPETDIICLQIVKGIPKAPGDTESAEQEMVILDLLDANGFSVQTDGWTMGLPGLKRGGTWVETQITDGRELIAAPKDNVTETIELGIGNQDLLQRYQLFTKLQRMADDARAFWADGYQIEPVYLKFKANGARVYQYALIYTISIADSSDPYEIAEAVKVSLVIEREPAWRMVVPPGGNPLEYWFWSQGKTRGVDYDWEDMSLGTNTDHLAYGILPNVCEFDGADKTTFLTTPWIDIDGAKIPGDAPALVCTAYTIDGELFSHLHMALSTEPRRRYDRSLNEYAYMRNTLNCGDAGDLVVKAVDACGARSNDQIANRYIHSDTILAATTTFTNELRWSNVSGDPSFPFHNNQMHGEWAIYLRCQCTNGSDGDIEVRAYFQRDNEYTYLPAQEVPGRTAGVCANEFDWLYMGRVQLPQSGDVSSSIAGTGFSNNDEAWIPGVEARNTAGANRVFEAIDLVFMPINEGYCVADGSGLFNNNMGNSDTLVVDNTGYFTHGKPADHCATHSTNGEQGVQLQGSVPGLKPGVDNRLYFLQRYYRSVAAYHVAFIPTPGLNTNDGPVRINIVPRCYGVADL